MKHQLFSSIFKSFMSLLKIHFAVNLIWISRSKEQPKTMIAVVHKGDAEEELRSQFLFQSPIKTSGEVLERATKVWWNNVRASTVFIQSSFFLTRTELNAIIFETGVVGECLSVLKCAQNSPNSVLASLISPTSFKGLTFFQTDWGMAAEDAERG